MINTDVTKPLDHCPFCGNADSDDGIVQITSLSTPTWAARPMWCSYVTCLHCGARGSCYYEEGAIEVAVESAYRNWQTIQRSTWWWRNVSRPWNQLRYDFEMWLETRRHKQKSKSKDYTND